MEKLTKKEIQFLLILLQCDIDNWDYYVNEERGNVNECKFYQERDRKIIAKLEKMMESWT